jgi:site-specific DNA-adenine methylase
MMNKKNRGQFYTTNSSYILEGLFIPENTKKIIEPFAGKGDLLEWIRTQGFKGQVQSYDIEPCSKEDKIVQRDTLKNAPDYKGSFVITNPPYLARNKSTNKDIYDQ